MTEQRRNDILQRAIYLLERNVAPKETLLGNELFITEEEYNNIINYKKGD